MNKAEKALYQITQNDNDICWFPWEKGCTISIGKNWRKDK